MSQYSHCKGQHIHSGNCYTITEKSYIIHTFKKRSRPKREASFTEKITGFNGKKGYVRKTQNKDHILE